MSVIEDVDVNCGTILAVLSMPVTVIIDLCQITIEYVELLRSYLTNSVPKAQKVS